MATTMGTSSSFMGLISGAGNSCSCLTLATGEHLASEFQIFPRFALFRRCAQQVGRMIGNDQWHARCSERVNLLPQTAEGDVRAQQIVGGDAPDGKHSLVSLASGSRL